MQTNLTRTDHTIQTIRAIRSVPVYEEESTTTYRPRTGIQAPETQQSVEAWARHATAANGFGDAGI